MKGAAYSLACPDSTEGAIEEFRVGLSRVPIEPSTNSVQTLGTLSPQP